MVDAATDTALAQGEANISVSGTRHAMIEFEFEPPRSRFHRAAERVWGSLCKTWHRTCSMLWRFTIGRWLFIKRTHVDAEAATMTFIRTHTNIPVPRVWCTYSWWGKSYILMSRAPGVELQQVWMTCTTETKERIFEQLVDYVHQLRALKSPYGSSICSVLHGPTWDHRLFFHGLSGPFRNEEHMNRHLRHLTRLDRWPEDIIAAHSLLHEIVFTHGDLAPRNIMVKGNSVTAILDWESSGWFPAHWEHCKARFASVGYMAPSWNPWIPRFIPAYEAEAKADTHLLAINWVPFKRE